MKKKILIEEEIYIKRILYQSQEIVMWAMKQVGDIKWISIEFLGVKKNGTEHLKEKEEQTRGKLYFYEFKKYYIRLWLRKIR